MINENLFNLNERLLKYQKDIQNLSNRVIFFLFSLLLKVFKKISVNNFKFY